MGQPYQQALEADGASAWDLTGMIDLSNQRSSRFTDPGIRLAAASGVLSGVPQRDGTFTFQIQAARGFSKQADARCYVLRVEPEATE